MSDNIVSLEQVKKDREPELTLTFSDDHEVVVDSEFMRKLLSKELPLNHPDVEMIIRAMLYEYIVDVYYSEGGEDGE